MHVEQISIFLENKTGRLAEVTGILSEAGVNIRALSLADTSDFGVLRLLVDNPALATETLRTQGLTVGKTDVVAVAVPDRPGGLHTLLKALHKGGINVEYMYAYVGKSGDNAVMIFRFDNSQEAFGILADRGFRVLDAANLFTA